MTAGVKQTAGGCVQSAVLSQRGQDGPVAIQTQNGTPLASRVSEDSTSRGGRIEPRTFGVTTSV